MKEINKTDLPMQAMKDIPTPNENAQKITALVKEDGKVTGYQLSNGQILGKDDGINLARQGGIQGVGVATNKGEEYLKSLPDGAENNNLSNLPSITK